MTDILPSAVLLYGDVKTKYDPSAQLLITPIHQHVSHLGYDMFSYCLSHNVFLQYKSIHDKQQVITLLEDKYVELYNNNHSPYIISFMPQRLKQIKENCALMKVLSAVCAFEDECAELIK